MRQIFPKIVFNSILGVVLIIIWSRFVNLSDIISRLSATDSKVIFPFLLFFITSAGIRAWRLQKILNIPHLRWRDLLFLNFLSQFLSLLIPIRAGEISKSVYLSTHFNVALGKTIVWVFIDRFMDFLIFILVVVIFMLFVPSALPANFSRITIFVLIACLILLILAIKSSQTLKKMAGCVSRLLIHPGLQKKFLNLSYNIIDGFKILNRHPNDLVFFTILGALAAVSDGFIMLTVFRMFVPEFTLGQGILGNALVAFTFLVPAAPGYVGSAEVAGLAVFGGILGIDANSASTAVVFNHILSMLVLVFLGIMSIYFLKFDLNLVWKKLKGG